MDIARLLGVSNSLRHEGQGTQWFELPGREIILTSVRFGQHAFVVGKSMPTMQIVPIGRSAPLAAACPQPDRGLLPKAPDLPAPGKHPVWRFIE